MAVPARTDQVAARKSGEKQAVACNAQRKECQPKTPGERDRSQVAVSVYTE
jgi:hypothetical protein